MVYKCSAQQVLYQGKASQLTLTARSAHPNLNNIEVVRCKLSLDREAHDVFKPLKSTQVYRQIGPQPNLAVSECYRYSQQAKWHLLRNPFMSYNRNPHKPSASEFQFVYDKSPCQTVDKNSWANMWVAELVNFIAVTLKFTNVCWLQTLATTLAKLRKSVQMMENGKSTMAGISTQLAVSVKSNIFFWGLWSVPLYLSLVQLNMWFWLQKNHSGEFVMNFNEFQRFECLCWFVLGCIQMYNIDLAAWLNFVFIQWNVNRYNIGCVAQPVSICAWVPAWNNIGRCYFALKCSATGLASGAQRCWGGAMMG